MLSKVIQNDIQHLSKQLHLKCKKPFFSSPFYIIKLLYKAKLIIGGPWLVVPFSCACVTCNYVNLNLIYIPLQSRKSLLLLADIIFYISNCQSSVFYLHIMLRSFSRFAGVKYQ